MFSAKHSQILPSFPDTSISTSEMTIEKPISYMLCHTLDCIGYDNETRRALRESNATMEMLDTLCLGLANRNFSCTIFGSQAEGTHVPSKMSYDDTSVRYLFCRSDLKVINDITEITPRKDVELLMVSDEITKPGYVKLQVIFDCIPQKTNECKPDLSEYTKSDYQNRVCVFKAHPDMLRVEKHMGLDTTTRMVTGDRSNILYESYSCSSWPDVARSWQNRARHYNWPSIYDLEQMKTLGILLVPVGCSDSIERHLEYKICFFLQERYLMDKLNQTQHKCYIVLKMINNSVISALVKEPALISYHLFHVIENTSGDIWVPSNLLCCLRHCLNCVLKCTISGMCPNYFNPEENLFCGRIHGELQSKLRNVLETLLRSNYDFLLHIECGNVGHLLETAIKSTPLKIGADHARVSDSIDSYIERNRYVVLVKDRILSRCCDEDLETCVSQHLQMIQCLKEIDTLAKRTKNETQRALGLALPWVELSFMNNLVAFAVTKENSAIDIKDILFSHQWSINARETNAFSAKLKQAAYMHLLGFLTASLKILNGLKRFLDPRKISICGCRFFLKTLISDEVKVELKEKSEEEIRTKHCMPCLVFLPTELVPVAIRNTMDTPESESTLGSTPYRFGNKWTVVDSKVLLFYQLYLNHAKLQMTADDDIEQLLKVLETDQNLGHKEIGWSILGWIYSQEGQHVQARKCFTNSSVQLDAYINAQRQYEK